MKEQLQSRTRTALLLKIEKFIVEQLWQLLLVVAFVVLCGWLFDKQFEAILFGAAHFFVRPSFKKQFHCSTTSLCLALTTTIAFFGIMAILPFNISLLSAIPLAFFVSWVGFIAQDRIDLALTMKNMRSYIEQKCDFSTDNCTEEELVARCIALGLSEENIWLAVEFFIKKTKHSKIAEKLCVEEASITKRKYRLHEKLNKK